MTTLFRDDFSGSPGADIATSAAETTNGAGAAWGSGTLYTIESSGWVSNTTAPVETVVNCNVDMTGVVQYDLFFDLKTPTTRVAGGVLVEGSGTGYYRVMYDSQVGDAWRVVEYRGTGSGTVIAGPTADPGGAIGSSGRSCRLRVTRTGSDVTLTLYSDALGTANPTTQVLTVTDGTPLPAGTTGAVGLYATGGASPMIGNFTVATVVTLAVALAGPPAGPPAVASRNFTVTITGFGTNFTVTPACSGGGTCSPTSLSITGNGDYTFTVTPAGAGSPTVSVTNTAGATNPAALTYVAAAGELQTKGAIFPGGAAGAVGYRLVTSANAAYHARSTYGVTEYPASSGRYQAQVWVPDALTASPAGTILWDDTTSYADESLVAAASEARYENGEKVKSLYRYLRAFASGKKVGKAFRDAADTKNRIAWTGNRATVTLDSSD